MIEIISARRSASRCSMTDMRSSWTGSAGRGPRCRTRSSSATAAYSVAGGFGLRRRALGGALRGRLRLRLAGVRDLAGEVVRRLAEFPHRLADRAPELGQPARPEDEEDHDQDHQQI